MLARAISFKSASALDPATESWRVVHEPVDDRVAFTARLAAAWARLRRTPVAERRVALILANYPTREGRIGNGVGLDTPASAIEVLRALEAEGYRLDVPFADGDALIRALAAGPTNRLAGRAEREVRVRLPLERYAAWFATLPEAVRSAVEARWGAPADDPHVSDGAFALAVLPLGNVVVGIQPARGYHIDPAETYHSPDLVPPHGYLAFYLWLRDELRRARGRPPRQARQPRVAARQGAGAVGGLLPRGGARAGAAPLPVHRQRPRRGHAGQAAGGGGDRRPPDAAPEPAEGYGELREVERLLDEYHLAAELDPRRAAHLEREILATAARARARRRSGAGAAAVDRQPAPAGRAPVRAEGAADPRRPARVRPLAGGGAAHRPDAGAGPLPPRARRGRRRRRCCGRSRRIWPWATGTRSGRTWASRGAARDPCRSRPWATSPGARPATPSSAWSGWRAGSSAAAEQPEPGWTATAAVLAEVETRLAPRPPPLRRRRDREPPARRSTGASCRPARAGRRRAGGRTCCRPGATSTPSTRARCRRRPPGRWAGSRRRSLVEPYLQEHGDWPRRVALSAWGTSCMRTGGDDLAQALALLGCRPTWDADSGRVTGVEVLPLDVLDRPRVDVTLRISGLFRDAFPAQVELLDDAVPRRRGAGRARGPQPARGARAARTRRAARRPGWSRRRRARRASRDLRQQARAPMGPGLQALIDEGGWETAGDLADAFLAWSAFGYGARARRDRRATAASRAPAGRRARSSTTRTTASTTCSTATTTTSSRAA